MRRRTLAGILVVLCLLFLSKDVCAKEKGTVPPHLIQTVTDTDIYKAIENYNLLQCPILEEENQEKAFENARQCVVRIEMEHAYGSGVVYKIRGDKVVLVTCAHVLDYWQDDRDRVYFPQGFFANATVWRSDSESDIGFLLVDTNSLAYSQVIMLREANTGIKDAFEAMTALPEGSEAFCVGTDRFLAEFLCTPQIIIDWEKYIDYFDREMLYCLGYAKPGMSGGGIFDRKGHLLGILAGGSAENETAGIKIMDVEQAYLAWLEE